MKYRGVHKPLEGDKVPMCLT